MYIAEMIDDRAEPCPMPTLVSNEDEEKPFHVYVVVLTAW